jgi:hypothetical protein
MLNWYLQSSIAERATLFLILACFSLVMFASFRSLAKSHLHVTWYRGIHATPAFQLLMWIGAVPLIIPAAILFFRRRRALQTAPYIANLRSRIYHARDCEYQRRINSDFLRYPIQSEEQAIKLGFKPCNWCISLTNAGWKRAGNE